MFKNKFTSQAILQKSILVLLLFLVPMIGQAQCAMCRAALQSSDNGAQAQAVNDGIVYLMIIPYVLVGVIGFVVYKSRKSSRKES